MGAAGGGVVGLDGSRVLAGVGLVRVRGGPVLARPQPERVDDLLEEAALVALIGLLVLGPRIRRQALRIRDGVRVLGRDGGGRCGRSRGGLRLLILVGVEGLDLLTAGECGEALLDRIEPRVLRLVVAFERRDSVLESLDVRPELGADLGEGLEAGSDLGRRLAGRCLVAGRRSGLHLGQRLLDAAVEVERRDVTERLQLGVVRLPLGQVRDGTGVVDGRAEIREVGGCLDLSRDLDGFLQHGLRCGRRTLLGGVLSHGSDSPLLRALLVRAVDGECELLPSWKGQHATDVRGEHRQYAASSRGDPRLR